MDSPGWICLSLGELEREAALCLLKNEPFCELRLDLLVEFEPLEELLSSGSACIVTCRQSPRNTEAKREELLLRAAASGAYAIDLDPSTDSAFIPAVRQTCKSHNVKLIISHHDFGRTPARDALIDLRNKAFSLGADLFKVATLVQNKEDLLTLISLLKEPHKQVVIGMGEQGRSLRAIGPLLGSSFTYVAPESTKTAPGQLTRHELEQIWKILGYPQ